jgi:hypothetical protein
MSKNKSDKIINYKKIKKSQTYIFDNINMYFKLVKKNISIDDAIIYKNNLYINISPIMKYYNISDEDIEECNDTNFEIVLLDMRYLSKYSSVDFFYALKQLVPIDIYKNIYDHINLIYQTEDSITKQLELYKSTEISYKNSIDELTEENNSLKSDLSIVEEELLSLKDKYEGLSFNYKELLLESKECANCEEYKAIANKLARFVRIKSKKIPEEATSSILEEEYDHVNDDILEKETLVAKNNLTEFNYLVELSKAQEKDLNYLNELVKL